MFFSGRTFCTYFKETDSHELGYKLMSHRKKKLVQYFQSGNIIINRIKIET
jgi:hypothetical protein